MRIDREREGFWKNDEKGLRKEVIEFEFVSIVKASEMSKCLVEILHVENLNSHASNYLNRTDEFWIEIGHSLTPVDCYIEEFLKQMLTNETSKCYIKTKSSPDEIFFIMRLKEIEFGGYYFEKSPTEMYELAKLYKENGVKMFKDYPLFAHNYFNLAAKCLLSFNTQDVDYNELLHDSYLTKKDWDELLENVYLNVSACLVKQERYEDIISILSFIKLQDQPHEKGVYRLAMAYYHTANYDDAEIIIKKINFQGNRDLVALMKKIKESKKIENDKYSAMAKKMLFG